MQKVFILIALKRKNKAKKSVKLKDSKMKQKNQSKVQGKMKNQQILLTKNQNINRLNQNHKQDKKS